MTVEEKRRRVICSVTAFISVMLLGEIYFRKNLDKSLVYAFGQAVLHLLEMLPTVFGTCILSIIPNIKCLLWQDEDALQELSSIKNYLESKVTTEQHTIALIIAITYLIMFTITESSLYIWNRLYPQENPQEKVIEKNQ